MSITALLALVCIALGLVGAVLEEKVLLGALEWFVLAIAFNTYGGVNVTFGGKR
jgi:hypothetical protein